MVDDQFAGQSGPCVACGEIIRVPGSPFSPVASAPAARRSGSKNSLADRARRRFRCDPGMWGRTCQRRSCLPAVTGGANGRATSGVQQPTSGNSPWPCTTTKPTTEVFLTCLSPIDEKWQNRCTVGGHCFCPIWIRPRLILANRIGSPRTVGQPEKSGVCKQDAQGL